MVFGDHGLARGAPFLPEIEEMDRSIYIQFHPPGKELGAGVTYEKGAYPTIG